MRSPTRSAELYGWHARARAWVERHGSLRGFAEPPNLDEPKCGYYRRRLVRAGPWVPAAIWMHAELDETGELASDETLCCEVAGTPRDALDEWSYLCGQPISESEYRLMHKQRQWARAYAPHEPIANERKAVDHLKTPILF